MPEQSPTAINTYSGKIVDFADPDPAQVALEDIAWGLSRICRFGAQSLHFYSVAQHAIAVAKTVEATGHPELALAALHHDSHEAYSADVPRPLKKLLEPLYTEITTAIDAAIAAALGIEFPSAGTPADRLIKAADAAMFTVEAAQLLRNGGATATGAGLDEAILSAARAAASPVLAELPYPEVEQHFLAAHGRLASGRHR